MNEQFTRISVFQNAVYTEGAPVVVRASSVIRDNDSGCLLAQVKLYSISDKVIRSVVIELSCFDSDGTRTATLPYEYTDLQIGRGAHFGTQSPIYLSDTVTRTVSVKITAVSFADGSVWQNAGGAFTVIPVGKPIDSVITDSGALAEYRKRFGASAVYAAVECADLYICTCGEICKKDETRCPHCGSDLAELRSFDVNASSRAALYEKAIALSKSNSPKKHREAKDIFTSLSGYEDSDSLALSCDEQIAKDKKDMIKMGICLIPIVAIVIILAVLAYNTYLAPTIAYNTGNYGKYITSKQLTEFAIPEDVTEIKTGAFDNCTGLKKIIIHDGVTKIGDRAFKNCTGLTSVAIPDSVTEIGDNAFENCTNLVEVNIPYGVTEIGDGTFRKCKSLTGIEIPGSVVAIGNSAFEECEKIEDLVIPDSVMIIGDRAFAIIPFDNLTFGRGVRSVGRDAFCYYAMDNLHVQDISAWLRISFANENSNPMNAAQYVYLNGEVLKDLVIPEGTASIGAYAFYDLGSLDSVHIPASLRSIGVDAFNWCFVDNTYISDLSAWCTMDFGNEYSVTGGNLYVNGEAISDLTVPENVTEIKNYAFCRFYHLGDVVIGRNVERIGMMAFGDSNMWRITVDEHNPAYVCVDGTLYTRDMKTLIRVYGHYSDEFTVPSSVTSIAPYAFYCMGLRSVTIPSSVTSIGDSAFRRCRELSRIEIPSSITKIGNYTFGECISLTEAIIHEGVTSIGEYAFSSCQLLTNVSLPHSVEYIGEYAFLSCESIVGTEYEGAYYIGNEQNPYVALYKSASTSITAVNVHRNTKHILDHAFEGCEQIESIDLPNGLISIGSYVFRDCWLDELELPKSLKRIGNGAFFQCRGFKEIVIPEGVTEIGSGTFYHSTLEKVYIPKSVTKIGNEAFFQYYRYFTDIYYAGSAEEWSEIEIGYNNSAFLETKIRYNKKP